MWPIRLTSRYWERWSASTQSSLPAPPPVPSPLHCQVTELFQLMEPHPSRWLSISRSNRSVRIWSRTDTPSFSGSTYTKMSHNGKGRGRVLTLGLRSHGKIKVVSTVVSKQKRPEVPSFFRAPVTADRICAALSGETTERLVCSRGRTAISILPFSRAWGGAFLNIRILKWLSCGGTRISSCSCARC